MRHRIGVIFRYLLALVISVLGAWVTPALAEEFLAPEQAFAFSTRAVDAKTVRLHWDIAPGYHLYRDRISVQTDATDVKWSALALPSAKEKFDTNFNKTMAIYEQVLDIDVRLTQGSASSPLTVTWQGCADAGLCYPPESATLNSAASTPSNPPVAPVEYAQVATDSIASTLASGSLLRTLGVFGLAGLLLAFTPCVLPMVPILSSLIAGQTGVVSRSKGFSLALAYSLGMALVYAGFGVAAGLAGEGLAAALQNPWVLGGFALILSAMALSMFGFYDLQMPSAIQSRATEWSNRFKGGSYAGVFLMGGVSALVVGPCVAAPLAGALVYISQTKDVVLGGLALFAMALGMSVPLLLVGLSAGSLLPRAGAWMERVKQVFGMMLLGVAIWMVSPVLPATVHMLAWAVWLLTGAALLGVFGPATPQHTHTPVAARASGSALATLALVLLVGAASGGQSVLQPLGHLHSAQAAGSPNAPTPAGLKFERVQSVQALDTALAQAQQKGQTVMLDFYADWCVACKELEAFTFSHPEVQKRLGPVLLLQADVTANTPADKALLKRFSLFGPPGMVFFDGAASTKVVHKVVGYQNPADFLVSLTSATIR
jgi:thiol:disulfide interchange protein DsbD